MNQSAPILIKNAGPLQAGGRLRFTIIDDPLATLTLWQDFEHKAQGTIYQSADWLIPWLQTHGRESGIDPFLVLAYLPDGELGALFPFGLSHSSGLRLVSFLGGADTNANMGLIRSDLVLERSDLQHMIDFCAASLLRPDAFVLVNQSLHWQGRTNPMALLAHQQSASAAFSTPLSLHGEAFIKDKLSHQHFKKLKKKERKLHSLGSVTYLVAKTQDQVSEAIESLFAQKLARLSQKHIATHLTHQTAKDFVNQCCLTGLDLGQPVIELHILKLNARIIAIFAGSVYQNGFYAMLNSFDTHPEMAKLSPGEVLLVEMIKGLSARGITKLDLGIGEARYKSDWCKSADPRFDSLIGVTLKGRLFVALLSLKLHLKRWIKQTPLAWKIAQVMRQYSA